MSDINKILEKLSSLEAKVESAKEKQSKPKSNIWAWIVSLILAAAVSIGAGLLFRKIKKKNEELARLRTQAEHQKIKARNLAVASEASDVDEKREQLQTRASELKKEADNLSNKLKEEEEKLIEAINRLKRIKSWDELDQYNSRKR